MSMSANTFSVSRSFDFSASTLEDTVDLVAGYFDRVARHSAERALLLTRRAPNIAVASAIVANSMPAISHGSSVAGGTGNSSMASHSQSQSQQQPTPPFDHPGNNNNNNNNSETMGGVGQLQLRDLLQETLTSFHSSALPGIDLRAYLHRIRRYCPCPHECFLALVVYTHRMRHVAEYRKKPFSVDPFSVHRLLIAGITVAVKFFSDFFYPNTRYARVGGLEPNELNSLEIKFLTLTNFDLSISIEELQAVGDALMKGTLPVELFDSGYVIPQSPQSSLVSNQPSSFAGMLSGAGSGVGSSSMAAAPQSSQDQSSHQQQQQQMQQMQQVQHNQIASVPSNDPMMAPSSATVISNRNSTIHQLQQQQHLQNSAQNSPFPGMMPAGAFIKGASATMQGPGGISPTDSNPSAAPTPTNPVTVSPMSQLITPPHTSSHYQNQQFINTNAQQQQQQQQHHPLQHQITNGVVGF